jgi:hypothetical protein
MKKQLRTQPFAAADGEGKATWFAGTLLIHKAEGDATDGGSTCSTRPCPRATPFRPGSR